MIQIRQHLALVPVVAVLGLLLGLPVHAGPGWEQALPWAGEIPEAYAPPGTAARQPGARSAGRTPDPLIWARQMPQAYGLLPAGAAYSPILTARALR